MTWVDIIGVIESSLLQFAERRLPEWTWDLWLRRSSKAIVIFDFIFALLSSDQVLKYLMVLHVMDVVIGVLLAGPVPKIPVIGIHVNAATVLHRLYFNLF